MRATRSSRSTWLLRLALLALTLAVTLPLALASRTDGPRSAPGGAGTGAVHAAEPARAAPADRAPASVLRGVRAAVRAAGEPMDWFGVAALDVRAGGVIAGTAANREFYAASLAKLVVAVDLVRRGAHRDDSDAALIRRMLGPSDDEAMSALWVRFDGPGAIDRMVRALDLRGTRQPDDPGQWGETVTTAADMARVYRHILTALPADGRRLLVNALTAAPRTATDGFDQNFGLLALDGARYAKQGWMYRTSRALLHSAGVLNDRYVVVLLAQTNTAGDPAVLVERLNAAAAAASGTVRG